MVEGMALGLLPLVAIGLFIIVVILIFYDDGEEKGIGDYIAIFVFIFYLYIFIRATYEMFS